LRKSFAHKSSIQKASNASQLISYSDVLLGFTPYLRFPTDLRCCEPLSEGAKTVKLIFMEGRISIMFALEGPVVTVKTV